MYSQIDQVEKRIKEISLELQTLKKNIDEIKKRQNDNAEVHVISYFTYTIMMPNQKREHVNIFGNFIIKNVGTVPINNPLIYLNFEPRQGFSLSGKIGDKEMIDRDYSPVPSMETWSYVSDEAKEKAEESGEYWLKPVENKEILPGETLSFTNFQIKLDQENIQKKFSGEGGLYSDELTSGLRSLNKINLSF